MKRRKPKPAATGRKRNSVESLPLIAFLATCLLAGLGLNVADVYYNWDHDSGYFLQKSDWVAQGLRPYVDFDDFYTPLLYVINAIPMLLGIPPVVCAILIPVLWIVATCAVTYFLCRAWEVSRCLSLFLATLCSFFLLDNQGHHVTLEFGVVVFSSLSLLLMKRAERLSHVFMAGAAAGLACLAKQIGMVSILPLAALALQESKRISARDGKGRYWGALLAGLAAPVFLTILWLGFDVSSIWHNGVMLFLKYAKDSESIPYSVIDRETWRSPITAVLLGSALALGLFRIALAAKDAGARKSALFVSALLIALVLYFVSRLKRDYLHYTINCWPFIALLIALPAGNLTLRKAWLVPSLFLAATAWNYERSWDSLKWIGYFSRWNTPFLTSLYFPVAKRIQELVPKRTPILILGEEPVIEYLAEMKPQDRDMDWLKRYDEFPDMGYLTVLIDHGQRGIAEKRAELQRAGYVLHAHPGRHPQQKVEIWKKSD